jgi:hypothetical protein
MVTNIRIGWRRKGKRRKSFQKSEKYLARFEKKFCRISPHCAFLSFKFTNPEPDLFALELLKNEIFL